MASIREEALAYEPKQIKNIADLEKVPVNLVLENKTFKEGSPDEYKQWITTVNGVMYKMPPIVLGQLKDQLLENPDLKFFKVKKRGEGQQNTRYTVIPLVK